MATVRVDATMYNAVKGTGTICTRIACSADTAQLLVTPTVPCKKVIVILESTTGGQTVNVAKGDFWGGKAMTEVTLAANVPRVFVFDSAEVFAWDLNNAEDAYDYRITFVFGTPAVTTYYQVIQLP